jgi:hypothetical protein
MRRQLSTRSFTCPWLVRSNGPAFSCVARARRSIAPATRSRSGPRQLQRVVRPRRCEAELTLVDPVSCLRLAHAQHAVAAAAQKGMDEERGRVSVVDREVRPDCRAFRRSQRQGERTPTKDELKADRAPRKETAQLGLSLARSARRRWTPRSSRGEAAENRMMKRRSTAETCWVFLESDRVSPDRRMQLQEPSRGSRIAQAQHTEASSEPAV